jgi:hypothetical protein
MLEIVLTETTMSAVSMRLPESLHRQAKSMAEKEGVSLNQLLVTALAEKLSALMTEEYLQERAARGSRRKFDRVLRKVSADRPLKGDELS